MGKASSWAVLALIGALTLAATYYLCALISAYRPERLSLKDATDVGTFVVLVFGLGSLVLLAKQIRDVNQWNRLMSYHQFFSVCPPADLREQIMDIFRKLGEPIPSQGKEIQEQSVRSILGDHEYLHRVTLYLDYFESLCGAINCGLVDKNYAYGLEGGRVIRLYSVFKPFINARQEKHPHAYLECETLALEWIERRNGEHTDTKKNLASKTKAPR